MSTSTKAIDYRGLPDSALLRQPDVLAVAPFSAATLWRRVRAGDFPQPIKVGPAMTAWRWGDVRRWLEARA